MLYQLRTFRYGDETVEINSLQIAGVEHASGVDKSGDIRRSGV